MQGSVNSFFLSLWTQRPGVWAQSCWDWVSMSLTATMALCTKNTTRPQCNLLVIAWKIVRTCLSANHHKTRSCTSKMNLNPILICQGCIIIHLLQTSEAASVSWAKTPSLAVKWFGLPTKTTLGRVNSFSYIIQGWGSKHLGLNLKLCLLKQQKGLQLLHIP